MMTKQTAAEYIIITVSFFGWMLPINTAESWAFGVVFGIFYIRVCTDFFTRLFYFLYNNSRKFQEHVDNHYGSPE